MQYERWLQTFPNNVVGQGLTSSTTHSRLVRLERGNRLLKLALHLGGNHPDAVALGTDFAVWHKSLTGSTWAPSPSTWESLGNVSGIGFNAPPTAKSWGPNRLDVFAQRQGGFCYHKAWTGSGWTPSQTGWDYLGGPNANVPFTGGTLAVAFGAPIALRRFRSGWRWSSITIRLGMDQAGCRRRPPLGESLGGGFYWPPAAVSWGAGRIDVFRRGDGWRLLPSVVERL